MKSKINPLTKALRYALITGLATTTSIGSVALAQEGDDDSVEVQRSVTVLEYLVRGYGTGEYP